MFGAITEPSPSSDEYDREDGKIDTFGSVKAYSHTRRARDGRASASPNAVVGDKSRLQMKRKESESMFASKKRARYPQDDIDLDGPTKNRRNMGVNSKSTSGMLLYTSGRHISSEGYLFRAKNHRRIE